jgi:hypothetical protein
MSTQYHDALEKAVWTDADFAQMGWHDATVHAIGFDEDELWAERLLLDLDYIVDWIPPAPPDNFTFLLAAATLVFEGVGTVEGELSPPRLLVEIDEIRCLEPINERDRAANIRPWVIDGHDFELRFEASGFRQHFRMRPVNAGKSQRLTLDQRGGLSFAQPTDFRS